MDPVAEYAGVNGRTVDIRGYRITLDTSALSHNLLPVALGWTGGELSPGSHEITLVPGVGHGTPLVRHRLRDFHPKCRRYGAGGPTLHQYCERQRPQANYWTQDASAET